MVKGLAPIFLTTCGVVVAGIAGYVILEKNYVDIEQSTSFGNSINDNERVTAQSDIKSVDETKQAKKTIKLSELNNLSKNNNLKPNVQLSDKKDTKLGSDSSKKAIGVPASNVVEPKALLPEFEVVRIEKDGSLVIAGRGQKDSIVFLLNRKKQLAQSTTNSNGEFVFVLDGVLKPGSHQLYLKLVPKEGEAVQSSSFAFVDIPKQGEVGDVTVLLAQAGKPSQLLQKPEALPKVATNETLENTDGISTKEVVEKEAAKDEAAGNVVSDVATASVKVAKPEINSDVEEQVDELLPVLIEAADVEDGKIYIAGMGEPKTSINIYLENDLLGSTSVSDNGAFLFEGARDIKPGRHNIRADLTKKGAEVLARAEVTLVHEPNKEKPVKEQAKSELQPEIAAKAGADEFEGDPEAKKEILTGSAVIIRRGDSLWTVARRNYGAGIRYTTIFDANRDQVRNPHRIYPGQVLKVPEEALSTE